MFTFHWIQFGSAHATEADETKEALTRFLWKHVFSLNTLLTSSRVTRSTCFPHLEALKRVHKGRCKGKHTIESYLCWCYSQKVQKLSTVLLLGLSTHPAKGGKGVTSAANPALWRYGKSFVSVTLWVGKKSYFLGTMWQGWGSARNFCLFTQLSFQQHHPMVQWESS